MNKHEALSYAIVALQKEINYCRQRKADAQQHNLADFVAFWQQEISKNTKAKTTLINTNTHE
jgi:NADH:ubiquinone oxidoreductase subunit B-like Fe-S oxidoreductase